MGEAGLAMPAAAGPKYPSSKVMVSSIRSGACKKWRASAVMGRKDAGVQAPRTCAGRERIDREQGGRFGVGCQAAMERIQAKLGVGEDEKEEREVPLICSECPRGHGTVLRASRRIAGEYRTIRG